eukprot:gnl/TRDRNA2_/TRDRNA2_83404_c0_seq1.p1 gnl/TRDRNA2_/TRDRNA2_83404_c0~~gnl/TRDRNA2_/TRDRNA2_83404_c0_seq1.p1  ORF type:complete len:178 (-),score=32.74 gnl/TRDRNA2_/TRDRNA2_83404_c0_seq1:189-653(-)
MAVSGQGPLGALGGVVLRPLLADVDVLRRLSHEAIMRRAEGGDGTSESSTDEEVRRFARSLEHLLHAKIALSKQHVASELKPWFERALAREPGGRYQTARDALEALDEAWAALEHRMLTEVHSHKDDRRHRRAIGRPERIVFDPPPELEEMTVL